MVWRVGIDKLELELLTVKGKMDDKVAVSGGVRLVPLDRSRTGTAGRIAMKF